MSRRPSRRDQCLATLPAGNETKSANQLGGRFRVCQVADRRLTRTWRVAGEADPGKLSPHATSAQVLRGAAGQGFRWHASTLVGTSKDMSRHPSPSFGLRNPGTGAN